MKGKWWLLIAIGTCTLILVVSIGAGSKKSALSADMELKKLVDDFTAKLIPLTEETALANYTASISGKDEDYTRSSALQIEVKKLYSDNRTFQALSRMKKSGRIVSPLLQRQLDVLYLTFLGNQIDVKILTELIQRQTAIEKKFNTYRPQISGKVVSDNDMEHILRTSTDSAQLEEVWKASKEIGDQVAGDIMPLVKLRNQAARKLGFSNFFDMQFKLTNLDPVQIEAWWDELDELTREAFGQVKEELDAYFSNRYGIPKENLRPWHYQNRFFQEAPTLYPVDWDSIYKDKDLVCLARSYYASIGLPVDDIIARSDLFEKPRKYQHAFCHEITRDGDVRVITNVKPNEYWMNALLHEFGHAVYSKYNDPQVPWLLRDAAHSLATEGIANIFARFSTNPYWLRDTAGISEENCQAMAVPAFRTLRLQQLLFSRWSQVMFRFEKAMYENPNQDLNKLWWDLVERYQMIRRPENRNRPDWASKIHVALYPAYYQNYLLGELFASQLYHYVATQVVKAKGEEIYRQSFFGRREVGKYLIEAVFRVGMTKPWNDTIASATGERLTPVYFAQQFVESK